MALIPPFMLDCVVAIGYRDSNGAIAFTGTGFLVGRKVAQNDPAVEARYRVFLVTNRHVLADQSVAFLRFNPEAATPAKIFDAPLVDNTGKAYWSGQPDIDIDIAALPIKAQLLRDSKIQFSFFQIDEHLLLHSDATKAGLSEGDGVYVLGFPMGNVGAERNYVVVRQGAIARIRDSIAGSAKEFLIDAPVFPGNSGGPVITKPEVMAIDGTKPINRALLIGVVARYLPYQDVAISTQTRRPRIIFEENSGLTSVVPIDRAVEAIEARLAELAPHMPPATPDSEPSAAERASDEASAEKAALRPEELDEAIGSDSGLTKS